MPSVPSRFDRLKAPAVLAAAVLALLGPMLLLLEPRIVTALPAAGGASGPLSMLRVLTDVDAGGGLTRLVRWLVYGCMGLGIVAAASLAGFAALRTSPGGVAFRLAACFALSALALAAEFVLSPFLRARGVAGPWSALIAALALALLAYSALRLLGFLAVFPGRMDDEELERAAARFAAVSREARTFGLPVRSGRTAWESARLARRLVRLAEREWTALLPAALVGALALVDGSLGTMAFWLVFLFFVPASHQIIRFRGAVAEGEARTRLRWVVFGFSLAVWSFVVAGLAPFALVPLIGELGYGVYLAASLGAAPFAAYLCIVAGFFLAAFYHGALDPDLALRRGTVAGIAAVFFVALFGAVENLVSGLLERSLPLPGAAGPMISGAVLAVALLPFRSLFRRAAARIHPSVAEVAGAERGDGSSA